jgi:hypothetical protein
MLATSPESLPPTAHVNGKACEQREKPMIEMVMQLTVPAFSLSVELFQDHAGHCGADRGVEFIRTLQANVTVVTRCVTALI